MKSPYSIIQICPCYVDLNKETGGVANIVRQICLQLAKQQQNVLLLCGNRELGKSNASPGRIRVNEFLTVEVFEQGSHPLLGPTKDLVTRIQQLKQPCVAHVHTCFSAFTESAMCTLHQHNIPFVFTPHGKLSSHSLHQNYWPKKLWWTYKAQRAISYSAVIGSSSTEEANQLPALDAMHPIHSISNGYERSGDLMPPEITRVISNPYILFLGYLDPRKQPQLLVEAFAKAHASRSHQLVFVGPDSYSLQESIQQKARELDIDKQVVFYGPAYGAQKWNLLQYADCLCLPSLGEGLPVVLCEAIGAGTPAIFSEECNFSEMAVQGAGIVVKGFDAIRWGQAIDSVCLDRAARDEMKAAARRLSPLYTWEEIAKRWLSLYDLVRTSCESRGQEVDQLNG